VKLQQDHTILKEEQKKLQEAYANLQEFTEKLHSDHKSLLGKVEEISNHISQPLSSSVGRTNNPTVEQPESRKIPPTMPSQSVTLQSAAVPLSTPQIVRTKIQDEDGLPFKRRTVVCILPDGREDTLTTDDQGYFEAQKGSKVYVPAHESAPAIGSKEDPLLVGIQKVE